MKKFKSHFKFNKQERSGIFFLLFLIALIQIGYFVYRSFPSDVDDSLIFDSETQAQIEELKNSSDTQDSFNLFPFNPNFITDFKGYTLGMSLEEIDRLHLFRKQDKFVNSTEDFQQVTQVSDSLLGIISPYFKFPDWTQKSKRYSVSKNPHVVGQDYSITSEELGEGIRDLNLATAEDLKAIYGIGEKLSARIVKFRDRLGGFLIDEQLYDVYGLEPQIVEQVLERFKVLNPPAIVKLNVNAASVTELVKLVYLRYAVAQEIVIYREENGSIDSLDELIAIEGFPSDKINRIALYLSVKE